MMLTLPTLVTYHCFSGKPGQKPAIIKMEATSPQNAFDRIMAVSCCPYKQIGDPVEEDWDGKPTFRFPIQNGWHVYVQAVGQK